MSEMPNITDIIARLDLNDNDTNDVVLIEELDSKINDALKILQYFSEGLDIPVGMYGSVNLGRRGVTYKRVRKVLIAAQAGDLPYLREFLTRPLDNLPQYKGDAGPEGQGQNKARLNKCLANVRQRIQRIRGMLVVLKKRPLPAVHSDQNDSDVW